MNLSFLWPYAGDVPFVFLLLAITLPWMSRGVVRVAFCAALLIFGVWLFGAFPFSWWGGEPSVSSEVMAQNSLIARWFGWGVWSLLCAALVAEWRVEKPESLRVLCFVAAGVLGVLAASDGFILLLWLGWVAVGLFLDAHGFLQSFSRLENFSVRAIVASLVLVLLCVGFSLWMALYATIQGDFLIQPLDLDMAWLFPFRPLDSYAALSAGMVLLISISVGMLHVNARGARRFSERVAVLGLPMVLPMYWMILWLPGMVLWFYVGMLFCVWGTFRALWCRQVEAQARHVVLMVFGVFCAGVGIGSPLGISGAVMYAVSMSVMMLLPCVEPDAHYGRAATHLRRFVGISVMGMLMALPVFPSFYGLIRVLAAADQGGWEGVWLVVLMMQIAMMTVVVRWSAVLPAFSGVRSWVSIVLLFGSGVMAVGFLSLPMEWLPFGSEFPPLYFGRVRMVTELLGGVWLAHWVCRGVVSPTLSAHPTTQESSISPTGAIVSGRFRKIKIDALGHIS